MLLRIFLPYLYEKLLDFTARHDWYDKDNLKGGTLKKLKFLTAFMIRFVGKLG